MNPPEAITEEEYQEAKEHAERREQALQQNGSVGTFDALRLPFQEIVEPAVPDEEEDDGQFWNSGEIYAMSAE